MSIDRRGRRWGDNRQSIPWDLVFCGVAVGLLMGLALSELI